MSQQKQNKGNRELLKYAGLGTQLFVAIGLAVFAGLKADKWLNFKTPLLVWILPLAVIVVMIYQIIKETTKTKKDDTKKPL